MSLNAWGLFQAIGDVKEIDWFSPSGEKILPNRQDISVTRNDDSSTLTIYKANIDNAGIYKCVAKDGNTETQATVAVKIYRKHWLSILVFLVCFCWFFALLLVSGCWIMW